MKKIFLLVVLLIILGTSVVPAQTRPDWLQLKNSPVVDVRQYGAKPDDGIDDTPAINAALAVEKAVLIPPGVFEVGELIIGPQCMLITGVTSKLSVLSFTGSGTCFIFSARNQIISDLTIDSEIHRSGRGIVFTNFWQTIRDSILEDFEIGIQFNRESSEGNITNCRIFECDTAVYSPNGGALNNLLYDVLFRFCDQALYIRDVTEFPTEGIELDNCRIYFCGNATEFRCDSSY